MQCFEARAWIFPLDKGFLTFRQFERAHVIFFINGTELLDSRWYVLLLGSIPLGYFFFSREILCLSQGLDRKDFAHGILILAVLLLPLNLAAFCAFLPGFSIPLHLHKDPAAE
jgi:hypothetical protein